MILEIPFQLSVRPIANESAKETKKPSAGSKDPSEDQGSRPSESGAAPVSCTQLVYVVSDLGRLQEWVSFVALVDTWICELWGPMLPYWMLPSTVTSEYATSLLPRLCCNALYPLLLALRRKLTLSKQAPLFLISSATVGWPGIIFTSLPQMSESVDGMKVPAHFLCWAHVLLPAFRELYGAHLKSLHLQVDFSFHNLYFV